MLLLGARTQSLTDHDLWTARRGIRAEVDDVLRAVTDPGTIANWAPVSFEVEGLAGGCLQAGSHERVSGAIAGIRTTFGIHVKRADTEGLELVAHGPVTFDVAYRFDERTDDVLVEVIVRLRRPRGLTSHILRGAVATLLNAGALNSALRRLESALAASVDADLVAA